MEFVDADIVDHEHVRLACGHNVFHRRYAVIVDRVKYHLRRFLPRRSRAELSHGCHRERCEPQNYPRTTKNRNNVSETRISFKARLPFFRVHAKLECP